MNDFKPPKFIKFPSDLRGIRYKNGKEEVKILCSDGEYHWIDSSRYKNRWIPVFKIRILQTTQILHMEEWLWQRQKIFIRQFIREN